MVIDPAALLPDTVESVVNTAHVSAFGQTEDPTVETVLYGAATGLVFEDRNRSGLREPDELALANVQVTVTDRFGQAHVATTDAAGRYTATVPAGAVTVDVVNATLPLGIEGEHLPGVWEALDFIFQTHTRPLAECEVGRNVLVIGAGNTAIDVATAARRLGKQWALAARVVEGHNLIQDGPYRFVRNPIYTGMFGMLLATGLVMGQWLLLPLGIVLFIVGTIVRVRTEERLLREAFGEEFEAYKRKVPALIPGIY